MNTINKNFKEDLSENGFTLLEVLIAITVLSFLMVAIYNIVDSSIKTKDNITNEDRERMQLEIGLIRVSKDIELIYSPLYFESSQQASDLQKKKSLSNSKDPELTPEEIQERNESFEDIESDSIDPFSNNDNFEGLSESGKPIPLFKNDDKSEFIFFTTSGRRLIKNSKQSSFQWVRYRLKETKDTDNKVGIYSLTRSVINNDIYSPNLDWDDAKEYEVIQNIKGMKFEFWSKEKEKFLDSLKQLNTESFTPRLVRINLTYHSLKDEEYEITRDFSVIWPEVDTKKNLKEKYNFDKFSKGGPTGSKAGGSND